MKNPHLVAEIYYEKCLSFPIIQTVEEIPGKPQHLIYLA
jgi:hypothetical protein